MSIVVSRPAFFSSAILLIAFSLAGELSFAQDVPPPKPKPNAPSSNTKPKSGGTNAQPAYGLVVKADVDCNVSVDGGDPILVRAGKAHRFASGLGQHLVQAESLDGTAKDDQSVDQKEPQLVVEMNLSAVLAKKAEEQRQERETAEAHRNAIAGLGTYVGNWISLYQGDESGFHGVWTGSSTGKEYHGNGAVVHLVTTWGMQLRQEGESLAGSLYRTLNYSLTSGKYDSFTFNGREVTSTSYTRYYTIQGSPQSNGKILLEAIYERCSGDCGEIDNNPRAEDRKGGTAELRGAGELDWTQQNFDPQTKVFKRQ